VQVVGDQWLQVPSKGGIRIAVGPDGCPWVVTHQMEVMTWTANSWALLPPLLCRSQMIPGDPIDIGVGTNGSVWVVTSPPNGEPGIFHWNGASWDAVEGTEIGVSVRPDGMPRVVTLQAQIYVRV
jgi:hypothetical protein